MKRKIKVKQKKEEERREENEEREYPAVKKYPARRASPLARKLRGSCTGTHGERNFNRETFSFNSHGDANARRIDGIERHHFCVSARARCRGNAKYRRCRDTRA